MLGIFTFCQKSNAMTTGWIQSTRWFTRAISEMVRLSPIHGIRMHRLEIPIHTPSSLVAVIIVVTTADIIAIHTTVSVTVLIIPIPNVLYEFSSEHARTATRCTRRVKRPSFL